MYFAGKVAGGPLTLHAQLGSHAIGLMAVYRAMTSGDLTIIAADLDSRRDAARFDLSEAFLASTQWATLSLRLRTRAVTHSGGDYPLMLKILQGSTLLKAVHADGTEITDRHGGYELGTFTSGPDHFPMFAVFFQ